MKIVISHLYKEPLQEVFDATIENTLNIRDSKGTFSVDSINNVNNFGEGTTFNLNYTVFGKTSKTPNKVIEKQEPNLIVIESILPFIRSKNVTLFRETPEGTSVVYESTLEYTGILGALLNILGSGITTENTIRAHKLIDAESIQVKKITPVRPTHFSGSVLGINSQTVRVLQLLLIGALTVMIMKYIFKCDCFSTLL